MNNTHNQVLRTNRPRKLIKKTHTLLAISSLFLSTHCFADTAYVGMDYMLTNIDVSGENAKPHATSLRVGVSNNNMAFEAQYIVGNNTDKIYRMEFDLEQSTALYFVMQSDLVEGFGLDVSLGYAITDMTVSGPEETFNEKDQYKDFSWGIAIHQELPFIENSNIRLGYQSLYKDSHLDISGISLGFTYNF
jgi:hypothetical protein